MHTLAGNNRQPECANSGFGGWSQTKFGHTQMSAASQANGLAESQDGLAIDWNSYENPARSWIDLVVAFKSGDPASVRAVLTLAKASHWNHGLFDMSLQEFEDDGSDTEDESDEDIANVKKWSKQDSELWEE